VIGADLGQFDRGLVSRWGAAAIATLLLLAAGCASKPDAKKSEKEKLAEQKTDGEQGEGDQSSSDGQASEQEDSQSSDSGGLFSKDPQKRIDQAIQASNNGNVDRARKMLERTLDDSEKGHLAAYNLGTIEEADGNMKAAAKYYTQALEKNPNFASALVNLVRLYIRQGRLDEADNTARKYIGQNSENPDLRAARLEVMLEKKQYEAVVRKAKEILRGDERNVEAMVAMAKANFWMERYELAKAILQRVSDLSPDRDDIYFMFGLIAMENDKKGRAIANFEKALQLNPRLAEAHNNLGMLYYSASDYKGAASQFQAAIDDYPSFKEAMLNLGNAYKSLKKFEEAEAKLNEVKQMAPDYADVYFNLGILYLDSKLPSMEKIPRLQKAIDMLNEYKRLARGQLPDNDPADSYIQAARKQIKAEKQRQKMMRQMQKGNNSGG
jgi:tetratricopeptide (TPR) repeat protein